MNEAQQGKAPQSNAEVAGWLAAGAVFLLVAIWVLFSVGLSLVVILECDFRGPAEPPCEHDLDYWIAILQPLPVLPGALFAIVAGVATRRAITGVAEPKELRVTWAVASGWIALWGLPMLVAVA